MLINNFESKETLIEYAKKEILKTIVKNQEKYKTTSLFLSGGSSISLYQKLAIASEINPKFVGLFQVDERFVPNTDKDSNQKNLLEIFGNYPVANKNFINTSLEIQESVESYKQKLKKIVQPDIVILGFGLDGHFASVFPDNDIAKNLESKESVIHTQSIASYPVLDRITITPRYISKAKKILVMLIGKDKKAVLEEFLGGKLGVAKFPAKFWLENENVEILTCFE